MTRPQRNSLGKTSIVFAVIATICLPVGSEISTTTSHDSGGAVIGFLFILLGMGSIVIAVGTFGEAILETHKIESRERKTAERNDKYSDSMHIFITDEPNTSSYHT